jgi:hypothetical protein
VPTLKKSKRTQINNLAVHLKIFEKQEQVKCLIIRRKKIKIEVEINEMETKETIQRINETKSWFSGKTRKIDKPLAKLTKKKSKKTQINKITD